MIDLKTIRQEDEELYAALEDEPEKTAEQHRA